VPGLLTPIAKELAETLTAGRKFPERVSSRVGERLIFVDLQSVTHFYAKDKVVLCRDRFEGSHHRQHDLRTGAEARSSPFRSHSPIDAGNIAY
jgi:hypothetical protein